MSKEKQREKIQDALCYLDDEMIEDVEKLRESDFSKESTLFIDDNTGKQNLVRRKHWRKWTVLAASVCILIVGSWIYEAYLQPVDSIEIIQNENMDSISEDKSDEREEEIQDGFVEEFTREESEKDSLPETSVTESLKTGVTIPQMEVKLSNVDDLSADMLGFFILNGRSYIQYECHQDYKEKNADFVGDYVGYITGTLNEWTEKDGYVEGAGTYTGNVYEVKGVSPEFMLCMVWEDGLVETFINHNGITLYKGADLVDDWLDLRGNYDAIAFETIQNNQFTFEPLELTEQDMKVFDRFLDAFAEGDYVYVEEKVEHPFGGDKDTADMLEFYFLKENGVRLRFRTLGDGYVSFPWIKACVKIDQKVYDEVVEVLLKYEK